MWPSNSLTDRLNLRYPILQAPMGSASTPALAAAALLAKPGDAPPGLYCAAAPHAEPAKPARIADGGGQCRRAGAAHRGLKDRPFEVQSVG